MIQVSFVALKPHVVFLFALANLFFHAGSADAGETKRPELILPLGHASIVWAVALSADGKLALTGSHSLAILWDVETGKSIQTFKGQAGKLKSVALSRNGQRALTASEDQSAILWDTETGKPIQTFKEVTSAALSSNGERVATGSKNKIATLWDVRTGKPIQTFTRHADSITCVALTADAKRVLTGSADRKAILWDVETGKPLKEFQGHTKAIHSGALSKDGSRVLTGSEDETVILWDTETGKPLQTFKGEGPNNDALSGDGKRVITGGLYVSLWDATSGKLLHKDLKGVACLALSADGNRVLAASFTSFVNATLLWDAETGKILQTFKGHASFVHSVAVSGDGKNFLTGSGDKMAILWAMDARKPARSFNGHTDQVVSVRMNGDGKLALTGSWDKTAILWDTETGNPLQTFKGHASFVYSVAMSGNGKRVLTGSADKTSILWDTETGRPLQTFKGNIQGGASVELSRNGQRALTASEDQSAILWDTEDGRRLQTFRHSKSIRSIALSGDGKRVFTGSNDKSAILWDAETGKPLQTFKQSGIITSVRLNESGSRVFAISDALTAELWDSETGKRLNTFTPGGLVIECAFGPMDTYLVTGSWNGAVSFWKQGREEPIFSFLSAGDEWMFWTPEGYFTCSPSGENLIAWKISDASPRGYRIVGPDQFRKQFYRPDLFRHLVNELDLTRALAKADKESGRPITVPSEISKALPPSVVMTPDRDGDIDKETITVEATAVQVGDHPVTRMRLLVDGRPYLGNLSTWDVPASERDRAKRSWKVDLDQGEHTVQVIAYNAVGSEGRSELIRIRRKAVVETLPRMFVLSIGISAYENESLRKGVYYSSADAQKFADTIEKSSKPLYREIQVVRLIDKDATRKKILQTMTQISKQAMQGDVVLIFFAGHGKRDDQNNLYLLPVEVELTDLESTGISDGDFTAAVKRIVRGKVILFLDACHSGALIENDRRTSEGLTDKLYRDLTSNEVGLVMMCSSRGLEVSRESPKYKSGLFTLALVDGLQGKARKTDGAVYLKALDDYVLERVRDLSEGRQHPLTSQATTITNIALTRP